MYDLEKYARNTVEDFRIRLLSDLKERSVPFHTSDIEDQSMVQLLEKHFLKWPPRDRRITPWLAGEGTYDFDFSDRAWLTYATMDLRVLKKWPSKGIIEIGVYLLANKADFRAYNRLVAEHNERASKLEDGPGIDPVTGSKIERYTVSEYWPILQDDGLAKTEFTDSDDLPGYTRPTPKYALAATISLRLYEQRGEWILVTQVRNAEAQMLFEDKVKNRDLSEATCQMVHRIFGNPQIKTTGNPYGGLGLLLDGAKNEAGAENAAPNKTDIDPAYHRNKAIETLFRYVLPTILIPLGLLICILEFNQLHGNQLWLGIVTAIVLPSISVGISRHFYRVRINILKSHLDQ